jgi:poly-gamma-glutamate capsule biosynthesis protein CapA/YwtB (metallophosphatase superfamily)
VMEGDEAEVGAGQPQLAASLCFEIKSLLDQQLFQSAAKLGQFMVAAAGGINAPATHSLLFADALFGVKEWRRAASYYEQAVRQEITSSALTIDVPTAQVR